MLLPTSLSLAGQVSKLQCCVVVVVVHLTGPPNSLGLKVTTLRLDVGQTMIE